MAKSWDENLEEYMISEGHCYAAGLAQKEDGAFYAAAPQAGEAGWGFIYADDHEEDQLLEDGESTKKVKINEATALKELMDKGKAPESGLWLGGTKYKVPQFDPEFDLGDSTVKWCFGIANNNGAKSGKKGVQIVATDTQIVCGFFDEAQGQSDGNCKKATLAFAEWLKGEGY